MPTVPMKALNVWACSGKCRGREEKLISYLGHEATPEMPPAFVCSSGKRLEIRRDVSRVLGRPGRQNVEEYQMGGALCSRGSFTEALTEEEVVLMLLKREAARMKEA